MEFPRRFFHRAKVNVPVSVAWDVFTDHERMGEYTDTVCRITRPGDTERNGLGCVRLLGVRENNLPDVEEVVNFWEPNKLFGYHVTSGAPISHHQGLIMFHDRGPHKSEWVYNMRLTALPEILEATPEFYDVFDEGFRQFMKNAECECERRGAEEDLFSPPAIPPLLSEQGGQLSA